MWNYWLGGKDNFAADREAAERVLEIMPSMPLIARAVRLFLIDAVHRLAAEHGVSRYRTPMYNVVQFLYGIDDRLGGPGCPPRTLVPRGGG